MSRKHTRYFSAVAQAITGATGVPSAVLTIENAAMELGDFFNVEVTNAGGGSADALTEFKVQLKSHATGQWYDFIGGTDFDSTDLSNMLFCTTQAPYDLASGEYSQFHIRVTGAYAIRFMANLANTDDTTVTIYGSTTLEVS